MDTASTCGQTTVATMESGRTTRSMELENTSGQMVGCTLVHGKTTTCMDKECTLGKMAGCMKESTTMTRSMALVCIHGLMADNTMACGRTASSMVKASTSCPQESKEEENGRMDIERSG